MRWNKFTAGSASMEVPRRHWGVKTERRQKMKVIHSAGAPGRLLAEPDPGDQGDSLEHHAAHTGPERGTPGTPVG